MCSSDLLGDIAGVKIDSFEDFLAALQKRHDAFHAVGARVSDHGMDNSFAEPCTHAQARMVFDAAKQVTGRAGDIQVDGAKTFATLNIGGSLSTVASFVVGVRG